MLIDWFTVGAQLLNFAILVWLLKRFLYKPVLDAIDAREMHVANAVSQAERMKIEAQVEREKFQLKNEQLDRDHTTLMKQGRRPKRSRAAMSGRPVVEPRTGWPGVGTDATAGS